MKENKGITLIALIITIIVLLILVAITIDIAVDGKLFDTAKEAVDKTNNKVGQQQNRVDELMGELDEVEEWEESQGANEHNWQYTDNTLAGLKCTCKMCTKESAEGKTYYIAQEIPSYEAGPAGTQWVVFGAEDTDKNGTNETLLLTTLEPSTETLELEGADGYNNGIAKIEAKVKEIYGNEARAMTIEDVNRTLGYTPSGGMYASDGVWQTTGNFTTKIKDLSIWYYIQMLEAHSPDGANTEEALGEYVANGYFYSVNDFGYGIAGIPYVSVTTSNIVKNLVFGSLDNNPYVYWLPYQVVRADTHYVYFVMGNVYYGFINHYLFSLFASNGASYLFSFSVRPVVPLKSEIPVGKEILVSNEEWDYDPNA